MLAIFFLSAQPGSGEPMGSVEKILRKAGHVIGYAMLAATYWQAYGFQQKHRWLAWILAVLYAMTDEYHQSFVPGRHSAIFDVLVYDNLGALAGLWLLGRAIKQQPDQEDLIVEQRMKR